MLVHLRKDPLFEITIPSKTQAYMAVGKPLLMAVDGDAADLVRTSGGGAIAASEDADALATAVEALSNTPQSVLNEMGGRAREFYLSRLSLRVGVEQFSRVFRQLSEHRAR